MLKIFWDYDYWHAKNKFYFNTLSDNFSHLNHNDTCR